jgi:endo-1,4-beta-D-glucanase Y
VKYKNSPELTKQSMKKQFRSALIFVSLVFAMACNHAIAQTQSFPANKTYGYGLMPGNKNSQDAITNYNTWKTNFVEACSNGRFRVKFDDRSQTVSEGIAYGMLLSAYAGDRTLFDGLWNYYKDNRNGNGVMNWKINGCSGAIGYNGATDSEVDAAMALIVADYQWGTSGSINYKNDAKTLITAIKNFEVEAGTYVLKPGDQFGGSNLTNASYFAPGYFRAFAAYMNDSFWINVADKAYVVINNNLTVNNAAGGLVSDWSTAAGGYSSAAGGYANGGRNYSYDAARTPWRIAVDYVWYGNASAKAYSKKSSDFVRVNLGGSQNVKDGYSQNGSAISSYHNSTFVGAFASAAMGGDNQAHLDNSYSDLRGINDAGSYFNQTLKTLYLFLLTGNFYLPGAGPVVPPVEVVQAPYGSAPAAIPGKIEAERYDLGGTLAYNDATIGNDGGAFRSDDVDIEATTDAGGGYNIGYTAAGEWLEYTVNVTTAGKYDFAVRVAAEAAGKSMHIAMDGVNITGAIAIPNTGGWQVWQTVTVPNISLTAGTKIMKVAMDTDGFNLNYVHVTASTTTPVNVAPTVLLTAPANNATYTAPASITLTANAADTDGTIAKVEFFNGSTLLTTDASAPYTYAWTNVAAGTYTLTARATDNSGGVTTSAAVTVTVNPVTPPVNVAPTVSLTAPANNAAYTAPASITLTANAADADGTISKVEFFNGSTLLTGSTNTSAPYTFTWTGVAAGTYTLTAKATDNSGAVTTSAAVTVTVNTLTPPVNVAPTVSLTAPANNAVYTAPASITLTANAADADGTISKVEFFNGSTLLTGSTNTSAPYTFTWTGVAAGTYTLTAKATDNSGAVTTSAAVTVTVNTEPIVDPGNCTTEAVPAASQWVVRNSWADQNNGSKTVTTTDALNIKHRQWGNPELWAIQTGKAIAVVSGQTYTIKFDVRNDAQTPATGIDVGFATGEAWNGAALAQPAISVSGLSSSYTTKTVTLTSSFTGNVYLALNLKFNGQPNNEVNVFIKNISVCSSAASASRPAVASASNEVNGVIMGANPFADQTTVTIPHGSNVALTISIKDMSGITVWESSTLQTNQTIYLGSGLPIGTYIVSAYYAGTGKVIRLIKY